MTRMSIPARLDCAHQIIYWLKLLEADGQRLSVELSQHVSSGTLNKEVAAAFLEGFTILTADLHRVHSALDMDRVEESDQIEISVAVKTSHGYFKSMVRLLFDQLNDWGEDAQLILDQTRERHSLCAHPTPANVSVGEALRSPAAGGSRGLTGAPR